MEENPTASFRRFFGSKLGWHILQFAILAFALCASLSAQTPPTSAERRNNSNAATNTPVFAVKRYNVEGNTLLSQETLDSIFLPRTGTNITLSVVVQAVRECQLAYRDRGYVTVAVALPRQQITNGVVRVLVSEGRIEDILVKGNVYYSSNNIRRSLPSLTTNVLLNSRWFQPELDAANASRDRQIYPVVLPGPDPGASAVELRVRDRLPLHGHVELDNKAPPGTPSLRVDTALQYDNLWQLDHQAGVQYNMSPSDLKAEEQSPRYFDDPLVASYSAFYRMPIGYGPSLREKYSEKAADFGYDPVARVFRLPPPTGNPEWIIYASRSSSETPIREGAPLEVTHTDTLHVDSLFHERDITITENIGTKFTLPLREFAGIKSSVGFGMDYKYYHLDTFSTNLTRVQGFGAQVDQLTGVTNFVLNFESNILDDKFLARTVFYAPLSVGWSGVRPDARGSTSFNLNQSLFLSALASDRDRFQAITGSKAAGGNYTSVSAGVTREQILPKDWSLLLRANGQWASAPLISNEQFGIGGTAGVRGYQEGEEYGDSGWRALADVRTPPVGIGFLPAPDADIPVHLRASTFLDYGERYLIDPPASRKGRQPMLGTGFSLYATIGEHVDARLTFAFALLDSPGTTAGTARVYFSIGAQF